MKKYLVKYDSNNSGGYWWLKDEDWKNLEKAGWLVVWARKEFDYKDGIYQYDENGLPKLITNGNKTDRWLDALAKYAFKRFDSITDALQEFEYITGQDISDEGCNCCEAPHNFSWKDENRNNVYCSGEECLPYLYPDKKIPKSIREAIDK